MRSSAIGLIIIILSGSFLYYYKNTKTTNQKTPSSISSPVSENRKAESSATFKIITNGTTRIFTDSKYHNLSQDVFITPEEPNKIKVTKENITWSDFFKTLPMSIDEKCLITGTKQTFCTSKNKRLYFYINNSEVPNALDKSIKDNDYLLVEYK